MLRLGYKTNSHNIWKMVREEKGFFLAEGVHMFGFFGRQIERLLKIGLFWRWK